MAKEFDKEDMGPYRPNPAREKVIASLAEKKYQSMRHLCQNTLCSGDDILSIVEGDPEISYKFIGGVMVYFLKVNAPGEREILYNTGENSFAVKEKKMAETEKRKSTVRDLLDPAKLEQLALEGKTRKYQGVVGVEENETAVILLTEAMDT